MSSPWDDPDFCKAMGYPKGGTKRRGRGEQPKFGNQRTVCQKGHYHRSKLEAAVCDLYRLRELAGEVKMEATEVNIRLSEGKVLYIADFQLRDLRSGEVFYGEAKGKETQRWPTIKRLWKAYGPAKLEVWKGRYGRPRLVQTIIPEERA